MYHSQIDLGKKPSEFIYNSGVSKSICSIEDSRKQVFWETYALDLPSLKAQLAYDYSIDEFRFFVNSALPKDLSQIYCNTIGCIVDFSIDEIDRLIRCLQVDQAD